MRAASTRNVHRREIKFCKEFIIHFRAKILLINNKTNALWVEIFFTCFWFRELAAKR